MAGSRKTRTVVVNVSPSVCRRSSTSHTVIFAPVLLGRAGPDVSPSLLGRRRRASVAVLRISPLGGDRDANLAGDVLKLGFGGRSAFRSLGRRRSLVCAVGIMLDVGGTQSGRRGGRQVRRGSRRAFGLSRAGHAVKRGTAVFPHVRGGIVSSGRSA